MPREPSTPRINQIAAPGSREIPLWRSLQFFTVFLPAALVVAFAAELGRSEEKESGGDGRASGEATLFVPATVKEVSFASSIASGTARLRRMRVPKPKTRHPLLKLVEPAPTPDRRSAMYYVDLLAGEGQDSKVVWWAYCPKWDNEETGFGYPIDMLWLKGEETLLIVTAHRVDTVMLMDQRVPIADSGIPEADFLAGVKEDSLPALESGQEKCVTQFADIARETSRFAVSRLVLRETRQHLEIDVIFSAYMPDYETPAPLRAWYDAGKRVWRPMLDPGDKRIVVITPPSHLENDPEFVQAFEEAGRRWNERRQTEAAEWEAEMARHETEVAEMNAAIAAEEARIAMESKATENTGTEPPPAPAGEAGEAPGLTTQKPERPAPESAEPERPSTAPRTPSQDPRRSTWLLVLASSVVPAALLLVWLLRRLSRRRAGGAPAS